MRMKDREGRGGGQAIRRDKTRQHSTTPHPDSGKRDKETNGCGTQQKEFRSERKKKAVSGFCGDKPSFGFLFEEKMFFLEGLEQG